MKRKLSYGYLLPSEDCAELIEYGFQIGEYAATGNAKSDQPWDYETSISSSVNISVDLDRMLRETGLLSDNDPAGYFPPKLGASLTWFSSATKLRGAGSVVEIKDGINELFTSLEGQYLGGILSVAVKIALLEETKLPEERIAPRNLGTIIWTSDELLLPLEGGGTRFTMTPIDFKKAGVQPPDAMWMVRLSDRLEAPVSAGVRVLVNTSNPITKKMLENPSNPEAEFWQKGLETEVMTLMVNHGVSLMDSSDFDSDFGQGSLGESIRALINSFFPQESLSDLAADAPRVSATIRASVFNAKES